MRSGNSASLLNITPMRQADGTYFTVIYHGEGCKMPIVAVVGIAITGEREVLAFRVGDREDQQAWEDLFDDLKARGVKTIDLWGSSGKQAMINAMTAKFATSQRQRCVLHKMENGREICSAKTARTD